MKVDSLSWETKVYIIYNSLEPRVHIRNFVRARTVASQSLCLQSKSRFTGTEGGAQCTLAEWTHEWETAPPLVQCDFGFCSLQQPPAGLRWSLQNWTHVSRLVHPTPRSRKEASRERCCSHRSLRIWNCLSQRVEKRKLFQGAEGWADSEPHKQRTRGQTGLFLPWLMSALRRKEHSWNQTVLITFSTGFMSSKPNSLLKTMKQFLKVKSQPNQTTSPFPRYHPWLLGMCLLCSFLLAPVISTSVPPILPTVLPCLPSPSQENNLPS